MQRPLFETLFQSTPSQPIDRLRDKFLARLFGIFSEEIVRIWCRAADAPYSDLGRPTIQSPDTKGTYTLDFLLRSRTTGNVYISELKCELEYQNYQFLTLHSPSQLAHHKNTAFRLFTDLAQQADRYHVRAQGVPFGLNGAILVWGRITAEGCQTVMETYGFADVLSVEDMITQLAQWNNAEFAAFLELRASWCQELFNGLRQSSEPA